MRIGITERGDPSLDYSWVDKLEEGNIIITKNLTNKLMDEVLKYQEKIILHVTITGFGNTVVEPNIPPYQEMFQNILTLISRGFPIEKIVVRIDPIFLVNTGTELALMVFEQCKLAGIKRVRFSFIDKYRHVINRFKAYKKTKLIQYTTKELETELINNFIGILESRDYDKIFSLETCAENTKYDVGCVSVRDLELLNIKIPNRLGKSKQRPSCKCISGKVELLTERKRCQYQCLYCYWYD